jgi:20S proteasome subunit alpha 4
MTRYDTALTVFSPNGHLFQVDYAYEAIKRGACTIGIKGKDCVVLVVSHKATPKLQDTRTIRKIYQIDDHIIMACSGLTADARVLANKARFECQSYRYNYEEKPSVTYVAKHIAKIKQSFTQKGGVRPYGISSFIIGYDQTSEPMLYMTEPSGAYSLWKACVVGKTSKVVQEYLEKHYKDDISLEECLKLGISAMLEVIEGGSQNIEVGYMKPNEKFITLSEKEANEFISKIEKEKKPTK